jgi:tetratricopeptide (TPR) repeat protein
MDDVDQRAQIHFELAICYGYQGEFRIALRHHQEAIRINVQSGKLYEAAMSRANAAISLSGHGFYDDALAYAEAALNDFQWLGDRYHEDVVKVQRIIAEIHDKLESTTGDKPNA